MFEKHGPQGFTGVRCEEELREEINRSGSPVMHFGMGPLPTGEDDEEVQLRIGAKHSSILISLRCLGSALIYVVNNTIIWALAALCPHNRRNSSQALGCHYQ